MAVVSFDAVAQDFLEAWGDDGRPQRMTRRLYGVLALQVEAGSGTTIRARADGRLCLIVGLYPDPFRPDYAEAWFAIGPGLKANLRAALAEARRVLEFIGEGCAPLTVRALIAPDGVAGAKIATWLGLSAAGPVDTPVGRFDSYQRVFPCPRS